MVQAKGRYRSFTFKGRGTRRRASVKKFLSWQSGKFIYYDIKLFTGL